MLIIISRNFFKGSWKGITVGREEEEEEEFFFFFTKKLRFIFCRDRISKIIKYKKKKKKKRKAINGQPQSNKEEERNNSLRGL